MHKTPQSNRLRISIFGDTNSGKSTLFNLILNNEVSIVSSQSGTTTDTVSKSYELIGFGPVVFTDTAGLNDDTILGEKRLEKTMQMLSRTDFAIYTIDPNEFSMSEFEQTKKLFEKKKINFELVITKEDTTDKATIEKLKSLHNSVSVISHNNKQSITNLLDKLCTLLKAIDTVEVDLIDGLVKTGESVVLVIPIDSEAPKGRLILPQAQLIRACLDIDVICHVTTVNTLAKTLQVVENVSLVVTDSQAFDEVAQIVPKEIPLTSFSILFARQKGEIDELIKGTKVISNLKDNAKILVMEACVHTRNHEDIGTVKIPNLIQKITNKTFDFDFVHGKHFTSDLADYDLVIHCGGCMLTRREMASRIEQAKHLEIPIVNYGIFLAYGNGILERSIEILKN